VTTLLEHYQVGAVVEASSGDPIVILAIENKERERVKAGWLRIPPSCAPYATKPIIAQNLNKNLPLYSRPLTKEEKALATMLLLTEAQ
jgi:hypothetical protein